MSRCPCSYWTQNKPPSQPKLPSPSPEAAPLPSASSSTSCLLKSDIASLLTRCFCIGRKFFLVRCGFDFDLVDRVPPGVVGVDGGDVEVPPVTTVVPINGQCSNYFWVGGGCLFIDCLLVGTADGHLLRWVRTLYVNFVARIALGINASLHLILNATACAMCLSLQPPLPDMLAKTFCQ